MATPQQKKADALREEARPFVEKDDPLKRTLTEFQEGVTKEAPKKDEEPKKVAAKEDEPKKNGEAAATNGEDAPKKKTAELEKEAREFVEKNDPLKRTMTEVAQSSRTESKEGAAGDDMADDEAAKGKKRKLEELEKEARDFVESNDPLKRTLTEVKDSDRTPKKAKAEDAPKPDATAA